VTFFNVLACDEQLEPANKNVNAASGQGASYCQHLALPQSWLTTAHGRQRSQGSIGVATQPV
jgi:hypothetical protein